MADIESNVKVNIDTSDALAQLKLLQNQISAFQQAMRKAGSANAASAAQLQQNLVNSINATGKFNASIQTIQTSAERFTTALEKNKLTMGEYFRYAGGASKTFGKLFKEEFNTINQVARERVKDLQTQYIKLGRDASGAMKAISVRPTTLDMENLGTQTQIAAQRQQLFNQLMKQGSTQLLNFGKNTQWAGRQLMVGFTIPLTMMGSAAAKAYMDIEKASIAFKRVYGDMNTTTAEANKMVKTVQALASEYTKYGVAISDTMDMAAKAAAMGKTGSELLDQIAQANKLAVLGNVDQNQALETTISLTNAFGISADKLGSKIDFLNAVENQTVTSIEDLTIAVPKAAPVIKQMGGNVEDLAFFLTAMKEGGINASEGANALKSGLASMINPTKQASEFLAGFGVNVRGIVEKDKGNVRQTVIDMAKAFDTLDPLNRARGIEMMFGKFQFSRISTLFKNVIDQGSQANTVAGLANQTAEALAVLSEREMKKISDSPMYKFQKSIEDMKAKLAPVGEAFLKAVTPIIEFVSKILDGFNNLGDGAKKFITILVTAVAGIGPVLLMTFGLLANGIANIMKLFTNIKGFINKTTKPSDILGQQTEYMTSEQIKGAAIAASLDQAHAKLKQTFTSETSAVNQLTQAYRDAISAQGQFAGVPGVPVGNATATPQNPAGTSTMQPRKYANGVSMVPGPRGAGDIVPALLSPGEAVIPAKHAQKYAPVIAGMVAGNLPGFESGTTGAGMRQTTYGPLTQKQTEGLARTGLQLKEISDDVMAGPYANVAPTDFGVQLSPTSGHSFPAFEVGGIYQKPDGTKVFVKPQIDLTSALAEIRGTEIARGAHSLVAPQQQIRVMMDPTDPERRRRFIVLESPLDERLANVPKTFSNKQYFTQLVASLLRGDKDLGIGNLGGDILADVGTAGVFQRASGKRTLGSAINSMEEQAIINLLGVKGGAKRFFAEATSAQVAKMTPAEYDAAMKAEISSVIPRLDSVIAGFGAMSPEESLAYTDMQRRLRAGLDVDWGKYQVMHSAVPPKEFALGGFVGEFSQGTKDAQKPTGWDKPQLTHLEEAWVKDNLYKILTTNQVPKIQKALVETGLSSLSPTVQKMLETEILGSLVSDSSGTMNQFLRATAKGLSPADFLKNWNSNPDQLLSSIVHGGTAINDAAMISASRAINSEIGQLAASSAVDGVVHDKEVSAATNTILSKYMSDGGAYGRVAKALLGQSDVLGEIRIRPDKNADLGGIDLATYVTNAFASGQLAFGAGLPDEGITQSVFLGNGTPWSILPEGQKNGIPLFRIGSLNTAGRKALMQKYGSAQGIMNAFATGKEKFTNSFQNTTLRGKNGYSTKKQANIAEVIRNANMLALQSVPDGSISDPTALAGMFPGQGEKFKLKLAGGDENVGGPKKVKPKASVFDIDDTLLNLSDFMPAHKAANDKLPKEDRLAWHKEIAKDPKPIPAGIAALKAAQERGNKILLMTARPESYDPYTIETLKKLGVDMNGVKLISRRDKDYRKPHEMKYAITNAYQKWYDIEEFYDDMDETRGAISMLGIPTYNPLKLAGGINEVPSIGYDIFKDVNLDSLGIDRFDEDKVGTTPGGFRIINGKKYYVKQGFSAPETTSEILSSALFSAMGNRGPQLQLLDRNIVGSKIIPGLIPSTRTALAEWISKQKDPHAAAQKVASALRTYIDKDVPFNAAIGNIDSHANNILFNPKTGKFENIDLGNSVLAGFTNFDNFQNMAESDTMRMKSDIFGAIRETLGQAAVNRLAAEIGVTRTVGGKNNFRDDNAEIDRIAGLLGFDLSKTSGTDPATNPKINPFIKKMIAENPELAGMLDFGRQTSTSGKTLGDSLKTLFTRLKRAKSSGGTHFFANGVFSVPGPKGAGDVVPAMLSPGEAVIPADKAEQHRGLISKMISGNLPGYRNGTISVPGYSEGTPNVPGFGGEIFNENHPLPVVIIEDKSGDEKPEMPEKPENPEKPEKPGKPDEEDRQPKHRKTPLSERIGAGVKKAFTRNEMTGNVQGKLYAASAIVGSATMLPGGVGKAAQSMMPAIGAATSAMSMIPGPAGMVVAGLAAIATVAMQLNSALEESRKKSVEFTEGISSGNKALMKFEQFAKTVSATEVMDKRRAGMLNPFEIKPGKETFGSSYMKTEDGKKLVETIAKAQSTLGAKGAKDALVQQLAVAVSSGVLKASQARSIAGNVGTKLGDTQFGISVSGELLRLLGPDGENLTEEPLKIRMKLVKESQAELGRSLKTMTNVASVDAGRMYVKAMTDNLLAYNPLATAFKAASGKATLLDFIPPANAAFQGAKNMANWWHNIELSNTSAAAFAAQGTATLQTQQQMLDSLDLEYDKRIAIAKAQGNMALATDLEAKREKDRADLIAQNAKSIELIQKGADAANNGPLGGIGIGWWGQKDAIKDTLNKAIEEKFKGTGMETQAKLATSTIEGMGNFGQQTVLKQELASGGLGLGQVNTAQALYGTDEKSVQGLVDLIKSKGATQTDQALQIAALFDSKEGSKKFMLDFQATVNSKESQKLIDSMMLVLRNRSNINVKLITTYFEKNPAAAARIKELIDKITGVKGRITLEVAAKYLNPDQFKALKGDMAYFNKLDKTSQETYLTSLATTDALKNTSEFKASAELYSKNNGGKKTPEDYQRALARSLVVANFDSTHDTGPKYAKIPEASFLDQYVESIRNASGWQQKFTIGFADSLKAMKRWAGDAMKLGGGLAARLQSYGADANFIQAVLGGNQKDIDKVIDRATGKLTKAGKDAIRIAKQVEDAKIGMAYLIASPTERMQKDNELYSAGLDVISGKEKKINDRYDKRIKALDSIGKLQDKNNQREQNTLDLADALSKGDIAAAARVAMKVKQDESKAALDDARTNLENSRKAELESITVSILGQTMTRADLEQKIEENTAKIADNKLIELNRQIEIGRNAVIAADAAQRALAAGQKIAGLPNPYNVTYGGLITGPTLPKGPTEDVPEVGGVDDPNGKKPKSAIAGWLGQEWEALKSWFAETFTPENIGKLAGNIWNGLTDIKTWLDDQAGKIGTWFGKTFSGENIGKLGGNLWNGIKDIRGWLREQRDKLNAWWKENMSAEAIGERAKAIWDSLPSLGDWLMDEIMSIPDKWNKAIEQMGKNWGNFWSDIAKGFASTQKDSDGGKITRADGGPIPRRYSFGGPVAQYFSDGGSPFSPSGTDTVPAMLTPGEFVIKKSAVDAYGASTMSQINNRTATLGGDSVYNYNVTLNVSSTSDSGDIADEVLKQIKRLDSQRIRSSVI